MSLITLVSGGIDSTLMAVLCKEQGIRQYPIFVSYGQLAARRELQSCRSSLKRHGINGPAVLDVSKYGKFFKAGITSRLKHITDQAFLPNRNLLLLLCAASYANYRKADALAIGLLTEETKLFPDQSNDFLLTAEMCLQASLGRRIKVVAPLREFTKADVVKLATSKGISGTYSCHKGLRRPCGACISCREFI